MTPAVEIAEWLRSNHQPDKATIYADRRPVEFGTDDAVVVHLEEQRDSYLLGGGLGYRGGGESEIRIGLWWIVNPRRDVAQRTPDRALNGPPPALRGADRGAAYDHRGDGGPLRLERHGTDPPRGGGEGRDRGLRARHDRGTARRICGLT